MPDNRPPDKPAEGQPPAEGARDPYRLLCGSTPVTLRFAQEGKTLDEAVRDYFLRGEP